MSCQREWVQQVQRKIWIRIQVFWLAGQYLLCDDSPTCLWFFEYPLNKSSLEYEDKRSNKSYTISLAKNYTAFWMNTYLGWPQRTGKGNYSVNFCRLTCGFQWRIFLIIGTLAGVIVLTDGLLHCSTSLAGAQEPKISSEKLLLSSSFGWWLSVQNCYCPSKFS